MPSTIVKLIEEVIEVEEEAAARQCPDHHRCHRDAHACHCLMYQQELRSTACRSYRSASEMLTRHRYHYYYY
jgi:hypothetical protein